MTKDSLQRFATPAAIFILVAAILVPYWKLTTMQGYVITDDLFTSDIMNESFPYRHALGEALKAGEAPVWLPYIYGGIPLLARAEAGVCYPFNLLLFGLLPPYPALNLVILLTLVTAAIGMFFYAREIGTEIPGALIAGLAFAYSGFMVSHIKHLSMIGTVCWYPLGLLVIERAFRQDRPKILLWLAVIVGLQNLSGHIQTAYYSGLVYLVYFLARLFLKPRKPVKTFGLWFLAGAGLGTMIGAVQLIPTYELVRLGQRSHGVQFAYASDYAYDPSNWKTFFYAAANGEISRNTYRGTSIFWEDYGYVGVITMVLGLFAAVSMWKSRQVKIHALLTLGAYLLVLGPNTPLFGLAFRFIPGIEYFRFPTRFLFVVNASLCTLAALGMGQLASLVRKPGEKAAKWAAGHPWEFIVVALVLADLLHFQLRQNPIVDGKSWLTPPHMVQRLKTDTTLYRMFSPGGEESHKAAFMAANGWEGSLTPYIDQREFLQASSNVLYRIFSANGYAQLTPSSIVSLWGDQNRSGLISKTAFLRNGTFVATPAFCRIMNMCNVKYVLSPWPVVTDAFVSEGKVGPVFLYRNPAALPRAYLVGAYRYAASPEEAGETLMKEDFNPATEVILSERPQGLPGTPPANPRADVESYRTNEVVVRTSAGSNCLLVLSDTFYPGWKAEVDGKEAPLLAGNLSQRVVQLTPGEHVVRFVFRSSSIAAGLWIAALGIFLTATILIKRERKESGPSS